MNGRMLLVFLLILHEFSGVSQTGNWWLITHQSRWNDNGIIQNELQIRNFDYTHNHQLLIRNGIGIYLTPSNNSLLLGHAYIRTQPDLMDKHLKFNEHRIYQQFSHKSTFHKAYFIHRFRLEERFIHQEINFRLRYFIMSHIGLNHSAMEKGTLYMSFANEIFLTPTQLLDRNRTALGLGYIVTENLKVQLDCLHQFSTKKNSLSQQIMLTLHFQTHSLTKH